MDGTGSAPPVGDSTRRADAAIHTPALPALTVAAPLGAAIWAAGWSWNAPFTPDTDAGMFTGHHGAARAIGCVITIPTVAAVAAYRGHPYAGAIGVSLGFGLLWSADAFITYSNVFALLGVGAMWLCVGAGVALAAWNGWMLRRDRLDPGRTSFDHFVVTDTDALTRWRDLRRPGPRR